MSALPRQTFRQWASLMVAAALTLTGVGIAVAQAVGALTDSPARLATSIALVTTAYTLFYRPCVTVGPRGVRIRNPIRDVDIPWGAITGAHTGWNLVIDTPGHSYPAWALASNAGPSRDILAAGHLNGEHPAPPLDARLGRAGATASAAGVAALIEASRPGADESPAAPRARVVWWAAALLILPLLAAVACAIVG